MTEKEQYESFELPNAPEPESTEQQAQENFRTDIDQLR